MPRRMFAYAGLATEKYNLPVYPVLINILPPKGNRSIANAYRSQFARLQTLVEYRVLNLWEIDSDIVFDRSLTTLLPFVPILLPSSDAPYNNSEKMKNSTNSNPS